MRRLFFFFFFFFSERAARGGGRGGELPDFSFSLFPCSADHERDWPPCKVVFFGLATNALNVRNNNNNNSHHSSDLKTWQNKETTTMYVRKNK